MSWTVWIYVVRDYWLMDWTSIHFHKVIYWRHETLAWAHGNLPGYNVSISSDIGLTGDLAAEATVALMSAYDTSWSPRLLMHSGNIHIHNIHRVQSSQNVLQTGASAKSKCVNFGEFFQNDSGHPNANWYASLYSINAGNLISATTESVLLRIPLSV